MYKARIGGSSCVDGAVDEQLGYVETDPCGRYGRHHLGEVVFMELLEARGSISQGGMSFGAVESVKATSDDNSPISGEIVEVDTWAEVVRYQLL